ncbi:hypothetical protein [Nonlabens xiamenensis]|uniref:hypothetical protein n=1 Tax=Nonlabens xiamenensis TaxID=2341043 RepID=UPI000F60ACE8|nr:hypothetical protein [Nonlabens xiamenensis]
MLSLIQISARAATQDWLGVILVGLTALVLGGIFFRQERLYQKMLVTEKYRLQCLKKELLSRKRDLTDKDRLMLRELDELSHSFYTFNQKNNEKLQGLGLTELARLNEKLLSTYARIWKQL